MTQATNGRLGRNFALRLTDEVRSELESMRDRTAGPRALGPWLIWAALALSRPTKQYMGAIRVRGSLDEANNDQVQGRVWQGTTETAIPVQVLVVRVACGTEYTDECERLARELLEQPVPCAEPRAFDLCFLID